MFDLKSWLVRGLVDGYKGGYFSRPYVTTKTADYIVSGLLTEADAAQISDACDEWDKSQADVEEGQPAEEVDAENA